MNKKISLFAVSTLAIFIVFGQLGCKKDAPVSSTQTQDSKDAEPIESDTDEQKVEPAQPSNEPSKSLESKLPKETAEMLTKMLAAAEKNAKTQTICPIMGRVINKDIFVDYKGKKVFFCCSECKDKFNAEPGKYLPRLPQFRK